MVHRMRNDTSETPRRKKIPHDDPRAHVATTSRVDRGLVEFAGSRHNWVLSTERPTAVPR
ncbi:MAG: hypothetical protein R2716_04870 [Microthrixaceae bacterium]